LGKLHFFGVREVERVVVGPGRVRKRIEIVLGEAGLEGWFR
jgi:hypothetical protein